MLNKIKNNKGAIATIIGFIFALPVNVYAIINLFKDIEPTDATLKWSVIMNAVAMVWFILPSKIKITSKLFNVELED